MLHYTVPLDAVHILGLSRIGQKEGVHHHVIWMAPEGVSGDTKATAIAVTPYVMAVVRFDTRVFESQYLETPIVTEALPSVAMGKTADVLVQHEEGASELIIKGRSKSESHPLPLHDMRDSFLEHVIHMCSIEMSGKEIDMGISPAIGKVIFSILGRLDTPRVLMRTTELGFIPAFSMAVRTLSVDAHIVWAGADLGDLPYGEVFRDATQGLSAACVA